MTQYYICKALVVKQYKGTSFIEQINVKVNTNRIFVAIPNLVPLRQLFNIKQFTFKVNDLSRISLKLFFSLHITQRRHSFVCQIESSNFGMQISRCPGKLRTYIAPVLSAVQLINRQNILKESAEALHNEIYLNTLLFSIATE